MRRRDFITLLGGAAANWPLTARAQTTGRTGKTPRVGILMPGPAAHSAATLEPFYSGLHELGYIVGQNLAIEQRNGDWKPDRFPALATELVGLKVDILVAWSTPTARAAKQATNSIPIVAGVMADPVGDELVASLGRPGGNVTGTTFSAGTGPQALAAAQRCRSRARSRGCTLASACVRRTHNGEHREQYRGGSADLGNAAATRPADRPEEIASAFSTMVKERTDAFIVMPGPMFFGEHQRIVELAANSRLPGMYQAREFVDAGGLMSYGANLDDLFRRTATYVDRYSKGQSRRSCLSNDQLSSSWSYEDCPSAGTDCQSRHPVDRRRVDRMNCLPLLTLVCCDGSQPVMCRFSDAGDDDLATRSGSRRPKSAKARNRGRYAPWPCRRLSYGGLSGERAACMPVRGERWSDCAGRSMLAGSR